MTDEQGHLSVDVNSSHLLLYFNVTSHICGYNIILSVRLSGPGLKVKVDVTEIFSIM